MDPYKKYLVTIFHHEHLELDAKKFESRLMGSEIELKSGKQIGNDKRGWKEALEYAAEMSKIMIIIVNNIFFDEKLRFCREFLKNPSRPQDILIVIEADLPRIIGIDRNITTEMMGDTDIPSDALKLIEKYVEERYVKEKMDSIRVGKDASKTDILNDSLMAKEDSAEPVESEIDATSHSSELHSAFRDDEQDIGYETPSELRNDGQDIGPETLKELEDCIQDLRDEAASALSGQDLGQETASTPRDYGQDLRRETTQNSAEVGSLGVVPAFLFIALAVTVFLLMQTRGQEDHKFTIADRFQCRIEQMKSSGVQEKKFWNVVDASMSKHLVDDNPVQPAVLMLVSNTQARKLREELAQKIAEAYSVRCNESEPVRVSGKDFFAADHISSKKNIDKKITSGFEHGACATVVSNFEKLPPASTTAFYQFCENDLAPFRKVAVIFTLEITHDIWDTKKEYVGLKNNEPPVPKSWDRIVDHYLTYSLQRRDRSGIMKLDMIGGLLSRITPSVAWVNI